MTASTEAFRRLHDGPELLILPNAWDAGSARVIEAAGAKAIATTSSGVAWALGWPDGDRLPTERLLAHVEGIVRAVGVPVSVDAEAGYADAPGPVADLVRRLADLGVAGVNLEDQAGPPEAFARKLVEVKAAAPALFVNARIDVVLRRTVEPPAAAEAVLARARVYADAGCDGVFVPGLAEAADIEAVAAGMNRPLNVMAVPKLPAPDELQRLGVRRLSAGGALASAAHALTSRLAKRFLADGAAPEVLNAGLPYAELQGLFSRA